MAIRDPILVQRRRLLASLEKGDVIRLAQPFLKPTDDGYGGYTIGYLQNVILNNWNHELSRQVAKFILREVERICDLNNENISLNDIPMINRIR